MKIVGGSLRGRRFDQPKSSAVRPLSDKVRAAIFDVYGDASGKIVLDVYAGSGAAGFEAISRGAAMVEAIEASPVVARVIESNTKALEIEWGYTLHVLKLETWLALPANQPASEPPPVHYDLIIADPPYVHLDTDLMERLAALLVPGGVLVVSQSSKYPSPDLKTASLAKRKDYGDTALSFYTRP